MSNVYSQIRQPEGDYSALQLRLRKTGIVSGGLLRAANMGLQVARTYFERWRFWIFGLPYVFFSCLWAAKTDVTAGQQILMTVFLASFVGCFVALHLRRQFGTPLAKVAPHYAAAHLTVGAAVSLLLWVAVPGVQGWLLGVPPWGPIGAHALAGLLLAIAVCWRQAIVLILGLPVFVIAFNEPRLFEGATPLGQFLLGNRPELSVMAIVAAIAMHLAAAKVLLGLSDQSVSISDDLTLEAPRHDRALGRLDELILRLRDGVVRRRLADAGFGWWSIQRWRVPGSTSWTQLGLAALAGGFLVGVGKWGSGQTGGAVFGLVISIGAMLIAPFNSWHLRRGALGSELLRPVTRRQYVWQVALAVAWDAFIWTVLASAFSLAVLVSTFDRQPDSLQSYAVFLLFVWSAAVFVYGVGLATFRSRYWLPLMVGLALLGTLFNAYAAARLTATMTSPGQQPVMHVGLYFLFAWILGGVLLAGWTIWRWLRADVV
ncbi:MAG: hypothetical protein WD845_17500 [Pirellulales bacterium]